MVINVNNLEMFYAKLWVWPRCLRHRHIQNPAFDLPSPFIGQILKTLVRDVYGELVYPTAI